MLFSKEEFNSEKYSFTHIPNLQIETFSAWQLCNEIDRVSQNICRALCRKAEITTKATDSEGKQYTVSIDEDSEVFNRDASDIHKLIFGKPEFEKHLLLLGFEKPQDKEGLDYACYLQVCWLVYFMTYFIFPKEKFWDLYDKKNLSSESMLEAQTGNEKYITFIMDNLSQNPDFKEKQFNRAKAYDDCTSSFFTAFFDYCNFFYNTNHLDCTKENIEILLNEIDSVYHSLDFSSKHLQKKSDNLFSRFMDHYKYNEMKSTVIDCRENYTGIFGCMDSVLVKSDETVIPKYYWKTYCDYEDIEDLMDDDGFIETVMNCDYLTETIYNKFSNYCFEDIIESIWRYEEDQIIQSGDDGFEFLEYDKRFCMSMANLAIICITYRCLPLSVSYSTKRNYLKNRADSAKGEERSIKRSYSANEVDGLDLSKSVLRSAAFRLMCMIVRKQKTGDLNACRYFELPLNLKVLDFQQMGEIDRTATLEDRMDAYQKMAECFIRLQRQETDSSL